LLGVAGQGVSRATAGRAGPVDAVAIAARFGLSDPLGHPFEPPWVWRRVRPTAMVQRVTATRPAGFTVRPLLRTCPARHTSVTSERVEHVRTDQS
jgi:hypothetical protein